MKKVLIYLLCICASTFFNAINAQQSTDDDIDADYERLSLNVHVLDFESYNLNDESLTSKDYALVRNTLEKRLKMIVTQSGFSGSNRSPKFMVFPNLSVLDLEYSSGAPTQILYKLLVTLYIADFVDRRNYHTVSQELTGIGSSKKEALKNALNSLSSTKEIKEFLEEGKKKILRYYNSQCESILLEAETFAEIGQYETAFSILLQVPKETALCYEKAITRIPDYYKKYQNQQCDKNLQEAKVLWAGKIQAEETSVKAKVETDKKTTETKMAEKVAPNEESDAEEASVKHTITSKEDQVYYQALDPLFEILPGADCYDEAQALLKKIENHVDDKEYFEQRQKHFDATEIVRRAYDLAIERQETQQEELRRRRQEEAARVIIAN